MYLPNMIRSKGEFKSADFYFYHGWAFPPGMWNSMINLVKTRLQDETGLQADFMVNNRGYFSDPSAIVRMRQGDLHIVVTHSLGLHFVPVSLLHKADVLVSISGFHGFHSIHGDQTRRIVERMLLKIQESPGTVLQEFYKNVFHPSELPANYLTDASNAYRLNRLIEDLQLLNENQISERIFPESCKILLYHGEQDRIVSADHTRKWMMGMNQTSGRIVKDAGHALPVTHSDHIVSGIIKSIQRLTQ